MQEITIRNSNAIYVDGHTEEDKDEVFFMSAAKLVNATIKDNKFTVSLKDSENFNFIFSVDNYKLKNFFPLKQLNHLDRKDISFSIYPRDFDRNQTEDFILKIGDSAILQIIVSNGDNGLGLEILGDNFQILEIPSLN